MMFFLCRQKTSYELRFIDWSSDVCSSDLPAPPWAAGARYFSGLLLVRAPFSLAVEVAGSELPVDDVAEHGFGIGRPRVAIVDVIGMLPHIQREQRLYIRMRNRRIRIME